MTTNNLDAKVPHWLLSIIVSIISGIIVASVTIAVNSAKIGFLETRIQQTEEKINLKFVGLDPRLSIRVDALEKRVENLEQSWNVDSKYIIEMRSDIKHILEKVNKLEGMEKNSNTMSIFQKR